MEPIENLGHQIVLLAIDSASGALRKSSKLGSTVATAVLAELVLQERVRRVPPTRVTPSGKIQVRDSRPTDEPMVDAMLADLTGRPDRDPRLIIKEPRDTYRDLAIQELLSNGWLALVSSSRLSVNRYRLPDDDRVNVARRLALQGFNDPKGSPTRAAYLAGMASVTGLDSEIAPDLSFFGRRKARSELIDRFWLLDELQARFSANTAVLVTAPASRQFGGLAPDKR